MGATPGGADGGRGAGRTSPTCRRRWRRTPCGRYLNFVEEAYDLREVFGDEGFARLQAVKAEHDPDGVFHANHPISLAP